MKVFIYDRLGNKSPIIYDYFTFSGGEEHIRFKADDLSCATKIEIFERITDSSKVVRLMIAVDALKRLTNKTCSYSLFPLCSPRQSVC